MAPMTAFLKQPEADRTMLFLGSDVGQPPSGPGPGRELPLDTPLIFRDPTSPTFPRHRLGTLFPRDDGDKDECLKSPVKRSNSERSHSLLINDIIAWDWVLTLCQTLLVRIECRTQNSLYLQKSFMELYAN